MKIIKRIGDENLAVVYLAETESGKQVEFVESVQPPNPREKKWVLIVSTLYGCPVGCAFCDAGRWYDGKLNKDAILSQIDFLIRQRYPDRKITAEKFKIQFARMGDPAFNMAVLDVIEEIPRKYDAPGFIASLSTVAPNGCRKFFDRLLEVKKNRNYPYHFQMQFSIHSTDMKIRDQLIPIRKWNFDQIAEFGRAFYHTGEQKVTLNFALSEQLPIEVGVIRKCFDPDIFAIKLTPVNPTVSARENNIVNRLDEDNMTDSVRKLISELSSSYELILSVGELEENKIGSNCGQYVRQYLQSKTSSDQMYTYDTVKS